MKAAIYRGAKDIRIEEVDKPTVKAGHCLVKVAYCGICGTDLHEYESGPILVPDKVPHPVTGCSLKDGICLGHEFSGIIEEVGDNVEGDWKKGDRVVIEAVISCKECYACRSGCNNACSKLGFVGISGLGGGLSEYFLSPAAYLHRVPDDVSLRIAAMSEPLAVAAHAVRRSGFQKGQSALVLGAGPIGCFLVKVLIAQGASTVIISEPSSTRRNKAKLAGAHHLFSPLEDDIPARVRELTGSDEGVDVAFEAAGNERALDAGIRSLKVRGTLLNVSVWSRPPKVDLNEVVFKERQLLGSSCYYMDHPAVMEALKTIDLSAFVTGVIPLEDLVEKGFEELVHNNEAHVKILVSPSGDMSL
ncbi:hypothetical protein JCM3775_006828 [Rhodotorula graminis]|uniref:Enoyl reductase (ER) domain-containing protein n=1 Tax=Rhodotorula graminis (strain WP1) TaxID=578459 RepID=A0A0P9ELV8_RHOGW|nr:uncharacterized protein RHOBADRAFT_46342 [Rhodotorula graminis WP1]KPV72747.1 hypothetical protein RHOBADRAFT_46342 [Rhodotorula graminis WP1]